MARELIARTFVALALSLGTVALGTWWASLLTARSATTLTAASKSNAAASVTSQLNHLAPGSAALPGVSGEVSKALSNRSVLTALANSVSGGSKALEQKLASADPRLAKILNPSSLFLNIGQHGLASTARRLREIARDAAIAAALLAAAALLISPVRHLILRHLGWGAGITGGMALLITWGLPNLLDRVAPKSTAHFANNILSGGNVVRSVLIETAVIGAAAFVASHLFALIPGRRFLATNNAPLRSGRSA